jgi:hypothetical protein
MFCLPKLWAGGIASQNRDQLNIRFGQSRKKPTDSKSRYKQFGGDMSP